MCPLVNSAIKFFEGLYYQTEESKVVSIMASNRLVSAGLELVHSQTEKSWIALQTAFHDLQLLSLLNILL